MKKSGLVLWITGVSGAGKSTLATEVAKRLKQADRAVIVLDGDELRGVFGVTGSEHYDRASRLALALQYSRLCRLISAQGIVVIAATISMFQEVHEWNRQILENYYEVYLKVPMEELRRRDARQIYSRYDTGELKNVAGLDLAVDIPASPDLVLEFDPSRSAAETAEQLEMAISRIL